MKKVIAMMCLSVLFFTACQKEGTVRLRVQVVPPESDEKVYIDNLNHAWFHLGDKILINGLAYRMSSPDGSGVYFVDVDEEMLNANPNTYDVFYPATNASYSVATHTYSLLMKSNQQYYVEDASGSQKLEAVMAGSVDADESSITLRNVTALLRVVVPPSFKNLISITVTAGDVTSGHNDLMSGEYKVNLSDTDAPSFSKTNGVGPSIILTCPGQTYRTDRTFYVVLPPTEDNPVKYKVTIYGEVDMVVDGVTTRVKAYAEKKQKRVSTLRGNHIGNIVFTDADVHENALPYLYTVEITNGQPTKKVRFSTGNLQWKYAGTHNFVSTTALSGSRQGTWRFAPQQYDICGETANEKIGNLSATANQNVWIDLFGYATSQFGTGTYAQPNACTGQHNDYGIAGGSNAIIDYDHDWGRNIISNADNTLPWYTMIGPEWEVVVNPGNARNVRFDCNSIGTVKLNGGGEVHGVILLPDSSGLIGWNEYCNPISCKPFVACAWNTTSGFAANVYTEDQWSEMEAMGAIFMPCAGRRGVGQIATTDVTWVNETLFQWSASAAGSSGGNTAGEVCYDPDKHVSTVTFFTMISPQKDRSNGLTVREVFAVPKSQW